MLDMKRVFAVIAVAVGLATCAIADTWTDSETGITWTYTASGSSAFVGDGIGAAIDTDTVGSIAIPAKINNLAVKSIQKQAFVNCAKITHVTIPNGVTNVGVGAFHNCSSLKSAVIPASVEVFRSSPFWNCTSLASVVFYGEEAPTTASYVFPGVPSTCTVYVSKKSEGWDVPIPGTWKGVGIDFLEESGVKEETIDGVTWSYRVVNGAAEVYNGTTAAISPKPTGAVKVPASLGGLDVKSVGENAFVECDQMTAVTIPDGVTNVGGWAFESCSALESVNMPDCVTNIGEYAFQECVALADVTIPKGVQHVSTGTFYWCSGLFSVNISDNLSVIGEEAFSGCTSLTSVYIPASVTLISELAFSECSALSSLVFEDGVVDIEAAAFSGCTSLTSVELPDSVMNVGNLAFSGCSSLMSVTLSKRLAEVPDSMFSGCYNLTNITIPDCVQRIGEWAFSGCTSLNSVEIGDGVKSIGDCAFHSCSCLASVSFYGDAPSMGDDVFYDVPVECIAYVQETSSGWGVEIPGKWNGLVIEYDPTVRLKEAVIDGVTWTYRLVSGGVELYGSAYNPPATPLSSGKLTIPSKLDGREVKSIGPDAFFGCDAITGLVIPSSVTNIGNRAFQQCYALESVTIPDSVTTLGESVFYYCSALKSAKIGKGVKNIGDWTFHACMALGDLAIGSGVTNIGAYAFAECGSLESVTIPDNVKSIGESAFSGCGALEEVLIGKGVTDIGDWAFQLCSSLGSVAIPANVKRVGERAFGGCSSLKRVDFLGDAPTFVEAPFEYVDESCVVYVPKAASGWSDSVTDNWSELETVRVDGTPQPGPVGPVNPPGPGPTPVPCYVAIKESDIVEPFAAEKAVVLPGAAYDGCDLVALVELKLAKVNAKKGTGKVSGTVTDLKGKRHTIKARKLEGLDGKTPQTVTLDVKDYGEMTVRIGGLDFAGTMGGKYHVQSAEVGGPWTKDAVSVSVFTNDVAAFPGWVLEDLLPINEGANVVNGKWIFNKAASVKWTKVKAGVVALVEEMGTGKGLVVDVSKGRTNLSGLKLTYTPKKGTFKGSFYVYSLQNGGKSTKLKKYTMNVTGAVVDGTGVGFASCRRPEVVWPVMVVSVDAK